MSEVLRTGRSFVVDRTLNGITRFAEKHYRLKEVIGQPNIDSLRYKIFNPDSKKYLPSIIAYHHVDKPKVFWVTRMALDLYGGDSSKLFYPVSADYSKFMVYPAYAAAVWVGKNIGRINIYPIRQAYLARQGIIIRESDKVTQNKRVLNAEQSRSSELVSLNKKFIRGLKDEFIQGHCLVIAPSGHRSTDGGLLPAEDGAGLAINVLDRLKSDGTVPEAYIIPVGINGLGRIFPDSRETYTMIIGEPLTPSELKQKAFELAYLHNLPLHRDKPSHSLLAHTLMLEMAKLVDNRGVYEDTHPLFGGVIRDEVKLGIDADGNIGLINMPVSGH